jgi:glycosyltransferase involved in cell wall biosynthesis
VFTSEFSRSRVFYEPAAKGNREQVNKFLSHSHSAAAYYDLGDMRIAHFVSGFPVLSETFVQDEIQAFAEEGFENIVVSLRPPSGMPPGGSSGATVGYRDLSGCGIVDIFYPSPTPLALPRTAKHAPGRTLSVLARHIAGGLAWPREWPKGVLTLERVLEAVPPLARLGIRHCHAHFAHYPADLAWGCSQILRTPFSWNAHSYDLYRYSAHLASKVRDARRIFPVSEKNCGYILGLAGKDSEAKEKTQVIRCGIRLSEYPFDEAACERLTASEPLLLGVGRLVDTKGFSTLIEAAGILIRSGRRVRVRIVGEGPERGSLERAIRDMGLAGNIELMGPLPHEETRRHQKEAAIAVQPCCRGRNGLDGIPVVLMEAMALGVPVVSTRFEAIPELVEDRATGRLVSPLDPVELARVLAELLEDPSSASEMAFRARAWIEAEYDAERNFREKARMIREILQTSNA